MCVYTGAIITIVKSALWITTRKAQNALSAIINVGIGSQGDSAEYFASSIQEIDTEKDKDARSVWERTKASQDQGSLSCLKLFKIYSQATYTTDDGAYHGKNAYSTGLKKGDSYGMGATKSVPSSVSHTHTHTHTEK